MSRRGRGLRVLATGALLTSLLIGTAFGDDDHFPFGPMRMYSTRNDPNATISVVELHAVTVTGERIDLPMMDLGLRRSEVDGLINHFEDDSLLARYLAEAYEDFDQEPPLRELRVVRGFYQLEEGRPGRYWEETLGTWERG